MIGEHIRALKQGRWTHAIDCGDETVIHLAEEEARPPSIRRSYRPEFVAGAEVVEVVAHRQRTFPRDEVVARAYSRIADPALARMFGSSEAFAQWCATGRPLSSAAAPAAARSDGEAPSGSPTARARAAPRAKPRRSKPKPKPKGKGKGKGKAKARKPAAGRARPGSRAGARRTAAAGKAGSPRSGAGGAGRARGAARKRRR